MNDADGFTSLNAINGDRNDWKVRAKVFLVWKQTYLNNPTQLASMELILLDQQGNKIIGSLKKFVIPEFEDTLKEGTFVEVSDFGVEPYQGEYRLINHNWKCNIFMSSKVRRCASFDMDTDGFNVLPFDDLFRSRVVGNFGFDVVGQLVSTKPMRIKRESGKETRSLEFELQDMS